MSIAFRTPMSGRSTDEEHRVSSPLELLFDLTFVIAIAQVAAQLAHAGLQGHTLDKLGPYLMVFFAIWWAWMNFTWFASAYDTDDVPYRLMTMLQMGGVLVLAAGVPAAFEHQRFGGIVVGYLVMRLALVGQWVRAAVEHPDGRTTAIRYAVGVTAVQVLWVVWGFALPPAVQAWTFPLGVLLELAVPLWAERPGMTSWHPHHIAERYGLFTIIVLGESVSAAAIGVQGGLAAHGVSPGLVVIAAAGLVLLFALWWLYFLEPAGDGLRARRGRAFYWGYGHYFVFASLAALGAGLEVAVQRVAEHAAVPDVAAGYAIAVPVAVFLLLLTALHAPLVTEVVIRPLWTGVATALILLAPLGAPWLGLVGATVGIAVMAAGLVAVTLVERATVRRG